MLKFCQRIWRDQRGFTLIELVVVVVVLSILAGVALLNSGGTEEQAKISVAKADLSSLTVALKVYRLNVGSYPTNLTFLLNATSKYQPMLDLLPVDPYAVNGTDGYNYTYNATTKTCTLSSDCTNPVISKTFK